MNFSNGSPISRSDFDRLLGGYGLPFRAGDLDIIWANIAVKGDAMNYSDFVRFINMDKIDASLGRPAAAPSLPPSPPSFDPFTLEDEPPAPPPRARGQSITDVLQAHRQEVVTGLLDLDPRVTGFISGDEFEYIVQRIALVNSADIGGMVARYDRSGSGSFNYFTLLSDLCNQAAAPEGQSPRRPPDLPPQPAPPPLVQAARPRAATASRADEIIATIATRMTDVFESSSTCYNKWRGQARVIGADEFVTGAKRDFKVDVTIQEAQEIIDRFSGCLTLGNFMKMVGAGTDTARAQRKALDASRMDPEEQTLLHIARQTKGKQWERVFDSGETAEQIVQGLKKMSIYVAGTDLRPALQKYGKAGIVEKIQGFIASL
jgi:hypothetical protein